MLIKLDEIVAIAIPAGVAFVGLLLGIIVRKTVVSRLTRAAESTQSMIDDIVLAAIRGPIVVWFMIAGLFAAIQVTNLPPRVTVLIQKLLLILVILSVTWAAARIAGALVDAAAKRAPDSMPGATLVTNLVRIGVVVLGSWLSCNHWESRSRRSSRHWASAAWP